VGQVLATLKKFGLDRNTLVVFMSDNGPWLNAGPRMMQGGVEPWDVGSPGSLRGSKNTTYEAGFRVPAIFRWPGVVPKGLESAEMATNLDLFPTVLNAAGAKLPTDRPIDGHDILPMLTGRGASPTKEFFYFAGNRLEAVREGKWKLRLAAVPTSAGGPQQSLPQASSGSALTKPTLPELFNLEVDPSERHDVAVTHPEIVERLRARLQVFATEVKNAAPSRNNTFR
jgi:arylsulfatase A